MRKNYKDIITSAPKKSDGRPRLGGMRTAVAALRAALSKGEADIAAGRITTLDSDEDIETFFSRL